MTDLSSSPRRTGWSPEGREAGVRLYLSGAAGDAADLVATLTAEDASGQYSE